MDFSESPRVQDARSLVREFMEKEVYPLEPALRARGVRGAAAAARRASGSGPARPGSGRRTCPRRIGGAGLSLTEFAHVSEELGRSPLGHYVFNCQAPDVGNMEILHRARHRRAEGALARARWCAARSAAASR